MKRIIQVKIFLAILLLMVGVGVSRGEVKTGTITFSKSDVLINGANVSANDNIGNTWTITTEGTTSFTSYTSLCQVGSANNPARSITFTTTLSNEVTFSKITAVFGGITNTAGNITLLVDDTSVGTGKLNADNKVTINSKNNAFGKTLTIKVTDIEKAVYCYSISYTYNDTPDTRSPVNITNFNATRSKLVKGETVTTSVTNDQPQWKASYVYSSSNTGVATINESGVIKAVGKGQATITVSLNIDASDANYKKGNTTYKSFNVTVSNPSHSYAFYSNGQIVKSGMVEEGTSITPPSNPADINGKVFVGWTTSEITGTTNEKPNIVTPASKMGTSDLAYYAVFAAVNPDGEACYKLVENLTVGKTYVFVSSNAAGTAYALNGKNLASTIPQPTYDPTEIKITINGKGDKVISSQNTELEFKYNGEKDFDVISSSNKEKLLINGNGIGKTNSGYKAYWDKDDGLYGTNNDGTKKYYVLYDPTYNCMKASSNLSNSQYHRVYAYEWSTTITYTSYTTTPGITFTPAGSIRFAATTGDGNYYATFSNPQTVAIPTETADGVTVTIEAISVDRENVITTTDLAKDCGCTIDGVTKVIVPANTGVLLHACTSGEGAPSVNYEYANAEGFANGYQPSCNMLMPCTETGIFKAELDDNFYYKLAYGDNSNKTKLGFWWGADGGSGNFNVKAGGAVLCVPQYVAISAKGFSFDGMEDATGVSSTMESGQQVTDDATSTIYNLQGIRLQRLQKGINIINGRKVLR